MPYAIGTVLLIVGYYVYDGFFSRNINASSNNIKAEAQFVGYGALHFEHFPEGQRSNDDIFFVVTIDNKTEKIITGAIVSVVVKNPAGDSQLFSFKERCLVKLTDDFRLLAGQKEEQACVVQVPEEYKSKLAVDEGGYYSFVTYQDGEMGKKLDFDWYFLSLEGHAQPLKFLADLYDWFNNVWSDFLSNFERVNR